MPHFLRGCHFAPRLTRLAPSSFHWGKAMQIKYQPKLGKVQASPMCALRRLTGLDARRGSQQMALVLCKKHNIADRFVSHALCLQTKYKQMTPANKPSCLAAYYRLLRRCLRGLSTPFHYPHLHLPLQFTHWRAMGTYILCSLIGKLLPLFSYGRKLRYISCEWMALA